MSRKNRVIPGRCEHNLEICSKCIVVSDDAKRLHDCISSLLTFKLTELIQRSGRVWIAIRLSDGFTDGTFYDTKEQAVEAQSNEFHFAYLYMGACMMGMPELDAEIWLQVHRKAYAAGMRLTDPGKSLIMPQGRDQRITRPVTGYDDPGRLSV